MEKSYEKESFNDPREEFIVSKLNKLDQKKAAADFEDRLMAKIRKIDQGEKVESLKKYNSWLVPSLSLAAGLVIAFFIFNLNTTDTGSPINQQLSKQSESTETSKDSVKELKHFDNKVNMVDQKVNPKK
jgi:hypothetical protein